MFGWLQKKVVKSWLKQLDENIAGMKKMANDYREKGGFKEVAETLTKISAEGLIPKKLLDEGRQAELEFADACSKLATYYEKLLLYIKANIENKI